MKHILYIALFFISAISYSQSTGSISGKLVDFESNNEPLMFAKITIKETGTEVLSDEKGFFKFDNLIDGEYTLVSSFVGYQTKELKVKSNTNNIKFALEANTISLEDLVLTMASADNNSSSTTTTNN
ncbi:carboxypeptidase-like regulatory domain-containing protein [Algibacter sp. PT7-4]|uniref:carboxypeptidase-like regulatory domain-containing protein n=1 Tax=Algibacter ulvanivorans TaxID=3400999 RepID=UPI003AADBFC7